MCENVNKEKCDRTFAQATFQMNTLWWTPLHIDCPLPYLDCCTRRPSALSLACFSRLTFTQDDFQPYRRTTTAQLPVAASALSGAWEGDVEVEGVGQSVSSRGEVSGGAPLSDGRGWNSEAEEWRRRMDEAAASAGMR